MGKKYGYKKGDLPITEKYSDRLIRLPLYYDLTSKEVAKVCKCVSDYLLKGE